MGCVCMCVGESGECVHVCRERVGSVCMCVGKSGICVGRRVCVQGRSLLTLALAALSSV